MSAIPCRSRPLGESNFERRATDLYLFAVVKLHLRVLIRNGGRLVQRHGDDERSKEEYRPHLHGYLIGRPPVTS